MIFYILNSSDLFIILEIKTSYPIPQTLTQLIAMYLKFAFKDLLINL